ncbi:NAD kinase b isoform X1 [Megalops cyprinoides]|uniref:NAD kinase b isoform X1 n=1 Tax=Megalops cyprinoides TaxID=118141 RepID=UPI001863AB3C|nr:NAD kinase b isoform X1 [Megalops cyprinoides]XP_036410629.1 NAD kinase b isoform X1 [Megalops cyprinoides]XP_036410630.1 NAD kinase b isoform X1 [Megalops cyprinoides]XP_036410631.1 NAD kinase b isoform X1 [Megalops cyprinoides]
MEGVEEMEVRPPSKHAEAEVSLMEAERPPKRRERQGKSPRRRRDVKRRPDDHEQLLRRRLPGQPEYSEPAASTVETGESSPKRWDRCRRGHFLHGPYPATHFGPKACILPNPTSVMHIQDPASQRLTWNKPPVNVLVIRKIRDESLLEPFKELCRFLIQEKQLVVYVEKKAVDDAALLKDEAFGSIRNQLCTFREGYDDISDCVDLIICLGGDGTLLYASSLFQASVPPVMAFHLGSLGFLTPFKFESYKTEVAKVFEGNAAITLRSRLKVKVVKGMSQRTGQCYGEENGVAPPSHRDAEAGKTSLQLQVLNEVVVDRGPSSYLSNVDLYLDGRLITSVQGDGVIVSTPTGSTAYAAAAGASMIHPNVPAIMVTPICPHSLSFRPIVVPAGVELMITLSPDARNTAWVSFDGRKRQEIQHGDSIKITTSCYPVPSICCHDLVYDWFESLAECLHWNVRKKQTRLTDVTDSSDTEN